MSLKVKNKKKKSSLKTSFQKLKKKDPRRGRKIREERGERGMLQASVKV